MEFRADFHMHTMLSDGVLFPAELVRRAKDAKQSAIAITDHADTSTDIPKLIQSLSGVKELWEGIEVLVGIEITHVPPKRIEELARIARDSGADIVIVHGETIVEPVFPGTNHAAVQLGEVDILAHPGLISYDDARLASKNGVYLEISARKGHCLANGHVAKVGLREGNDFVVNTDLHEPDFLDYEGALRIAVAAGLDPEAAEAAVVDSPLSILRRIRTRA